MLDQTLQNRYTITAKLGKGAMGTVYRATDTQTGQNVAVKVLSRDLAIDGEMLERFRREGEALRRLRHPNIVGFVDMFEHAEHHIIVMDYVPGGNLHDLIQQGPVPVERARRIALGLCDALTRSHDLTIVHRDIKPENVLLAEDGTPMLSDFGVARLMEAGTRLTGTGTQVGTPYYMAPEAWEGKPLDAQADVWALGVVLYEMLTGQVPFGGDTLIAVMNKVLNSPLADLRQINPGVPPGLAQVVAIMLTRDKAQRYASMRLVAADLERGGPSIASPALTRRALPKPPGLHVPAWAWIVGGAVIVGLVIGAIVIGPRLLAAQATPTAQGTATTVTAKGVPTAIATLPATRPTPVARAKSQRLAVCDQDLCIYDGQGSRTPLKLTTQFTNLQGGMSWSPDGQQIVFNAYPAGPAAQPYYWQLYIISVDGQTVKPITNAPPDEANYQAPAWSPDGQSIAYQHQGRLEVMRFDGQAWTLDRSYDGIGDCPFSLAWSPDSRRIAWSAGPCGPDKPNLPVQVVVTDRSSGETFTLFDAGANVLQQGPGNSTIAWSPDGKTVAVQLLAHSAWMQIDAGCPQQAGGCDAASRQTATNISPEWLTTYWPQWGGAQPASAAPR